jgi:L-malate glycosyltransferase
VATATCELTKKIVSGTAEGLKTICQVLHGLRIGGAEVLAAGLARRLRDRFRFCFVCLDECGELGEQLRDEGFAVHVLDRRPGIDWRCTWRLARWLRREQVDVVHAHQYTPFFYSMMARMLVRRPGVLFHEHGRHFPDYPRRKRIWANRLLLRRRDRVVSVGQAVQRALVQNEGIRQERISVIYNGINVDAFKSSETDRHQVRVDLGVNARDFLIVQVARLDYLKDHAAAIRTLARVIRKLPQAKLLLVGEGPEMPKIKDAVAQYGLAERVHFLGLRTDVPRLLAAADVFLLTSISEGIPVTVIEAMAAGLPIVSTRVGGVSEVVLDGNTGLLSESGDDMGLAQHILHLADNPGERCRLGQEGRKRAEQQFSAVQMDRGYAALYEEMLA